MRPVEHLVIIEPHSDDAWLSLGEHLLFWQRSETHRVTIVTVFGDATRCREAARYAEAVGAEHIALGVPEGGQGLGAEWVTELPTDVFAGIMRLDGGFFIGPLGLRHPEHQAVAARLDADAWYVELPYALTQANGDELRSRACGREIMSMRVRSARANQAAPIFRTQSMFWRNNRERMVGAMEVVLA